MRPLLSAGCVKAQDLVAFLRAQYSKLMPDFFESYLPEDMKTSG